MKIYINEKGNPAKRIIIEAELIEERETIITVRLPDGNIIKRKKKRDIVKEEK